MTRDDVLAALARLGRRTKVNPETGHIAVLHRVRGRDAPIFLTVRAAAIEVGWRPGVAAATLRGAVSDAELGAALDGLTPPGD